MKYFSRIKDTNFFFLYFRSVNRIFFKRAFGRWVVGHQSLSTSAWALRLEKKYPRFFRFLVLRFDVQHFRGLPLTSLICGILLNVFILSQLADEILELSKLHLLDQNLANYFYTNRNEVFAQFIYRFTRIGSSLIVLFILGLLSFFSFYKRRFHAWIAIATALGASTLTAYVGKVYYHFPRPLGLAWYEELSYSFPSGHATVAMAYYGILFYVWMMHMKSIAAKNLIFVFGIFFIVGMGFSRVYLGVHYLSDVLGGYAIGFVWLIFSIALLSWMDFRKEIRNKK